MQESIQLVIDSFAVPAERGWVYAATQYRRHVFWLTARVYSRADAPVANLARALAGAFYISIFRGTPLIAQLFMIYYGLPQFGIELDPIPSAMIGLSLNTAAYAAETLRAAISSIDKGQWEAAASIGMTPWQTMRRAILPQAARVALPPLSNSFISPVKIRRWPRQSSAGAVPSGAVDYLAHAGGVHHVLAASLIYWIMATVLSTLQNHFENQLNRRRGNPNECH